VLHRHTPYLYLRWPTRTSKKRQGEGGDEVMGREGEDMRGKGAQVCPFHSSWGIWIWEWRKEGRKGEGQ